MDEGHSYACMTVEQVQEVLRQTLLRVCREKGRVELRDGEHCCVLISKEELESLERALDILSNTSEVQRIARTIAAVTYTVAQGPLIAVGPDEE